ncbi:hypothetical protein ACFLZH_01275 [Patescibacteria group bacterium]
MEACPEKPRTTKEKLLTGSMIAIFAISLTVAGACQVMLPNGKTMSKSAYLKKRNQARKKCKNLLPEPLRNKKFEEVHCHPCAEKFRACIDAEFK